MHVGCDYVKRIKGRVRLEFDVGVELLCTWTKLYLDGNVGDVEVLKVSMVSTTSRVWLAYYFILFLIKTCLVS